MDRAKFLLTVCIPAYNASRYIKETLDSVVNQDTDFPFEVLISDDCSTDNTLQICQLYANKYPNVRVIHQEQNLGMAANQHFVLSAPKTPYLAYLDSDDYYASPDYLQRQVEFLQAHPEVVVVFSNVEVFSESRVIKERYTYTNRPPKVFDLHQFIKQNIHITNSAMVIKRSAHADVPEYFANYFQYDWLLHIHHGLRGKFGYNDFVGTRYRLHETNATKTKSEKVLRDGIKLAPFLHEYLPDEYRNYFSHNSEYINRLAFYYFRKGKVLMFIKWYMKWLWVTPVNYYNPRDQWYRLKKSVRFK